MLKITADVFSGRPNPTWFADADEAENILRELARSKQAIGSLTDGYQGLGYRGLIIEAASDNDVTGKHGLPDTIRVGHAPGGDEVVKGLLSSMLRAQVLDKDLHGMITAAHQSAQTHATAISRGESTESDSAGASPAGGPAARLEPQAESITCYIELGAFNPGFWNDAYHVQRNNCYNYASNKRTDTFAQPGRASGHPITALACPNVTAAALSDGLHHRYDCFPDSEKPRWLVAMVVAPGQDYHWYRKQKEGFWGHKPGHTPAKNTDNNGAIIWNPETCARAPYTNFCGYFYVPKSQKIN